MDTSKFPNIYKILEKMDIDKKDFLEQQKIFSITQEFYEKLLDELEKL